LQGEDTLVLLDVPQTDSPITGAGCDVATIGSKVQ
jgi:hypothetical protein